MDRHVGGVAEFPVGGQFFPGVAENEGNSPTIRRGYLADDDNEHDLDHQHVKKSVLAKVKEKALKWKNMLAKKKHGQDKKNETPPWGASLDEDDEEDPGYYGAPRYESEIAPDSYKESSPRQIQSAPITHVEAEVLVMHDNEKTNLKQISAASTTLNRQETTLLNLEKNDTNTTPRSPVMELPLHHVSSPTTVSDSPSKELAMKHADELAQYYLDEFEASTPTHRKTPATVGDRTLHAGLPNKDDKHEQATKELNNNDALTEDKEDCHTNEGNPDAKKESVEVSGDNNKSLTETVTEMLAPAYHMVSEATHAIASKVQRTSTRDEVGAKLSYDKGVSMKEYIMHKLEPGEDEKALSKVIMEAMSPKGNMDSGEAGETGVVEKVRVAVSMLMRKEETTKESPIPVSTLPHTEIIEEQQEQGERRLQAYAN